MHIELLLISENLTGQQPLDFTAEQRLPPYATHPLIQCCPLEAVRPVSSASYQCRVPLTYLRETKKFVVPELPEAPLIVFINSRSGGRAGPKLAETLFHALGHSQVRLTRSFVLDAAL